MIWPPAKAWTSKVCINKQVHFVAINYGGEPLNRWVILMSVLDSSVVVKVSWSKLVDSSNWVPGWAEINYVKSSKLVNSKVDLSTTYLIHPSNDSGLTIPITKNSIRPWFEMS
tara:strand:- start:640 stop:978 length:339 start_codon:yes stop_codon:yes gene_type:complete